MAGGRLAASCTDPNDEFCAPSCSDAATLGAAAAWGAVERHPPPRPVMIGLVDATPNALDDLRQNLWRNEREVANDLDDDADGVVDDVYGFDAQAGRGIDDFALDVATRGNDDHGTSVASIIAAIGNNGRGATGLVWRAQLVLCNALETTGQLAACLDYFIRLRERGEPLIAINVSIAGHQCSCAVEALIRRLRDLGVLLVAAAGNEGCPNDATTPDAPRCATWNGPRATTCGSCPFYPASYPVSNVIAVGAATCSGAPQRCSNFGPRSVHLYAPGSDVLTLGDRAFRNTSAAAPHVTGAIALVKSTPAGAALDWRALRNLVLAGGMPMTALLGTAPAAPRERALQTITGRYLKIAAAADVDGGRYGMLGCRGQRVRRRLQPVGDRIALARDTPLRLVALDIVCAASQPPVPVRVERRGAAGWQALAPPPPLADDGRGADEYAGDGEHAGSWGAHDPGSYRLRFWNPPGADDGDDLYVDVR